MASFDRYALVADDDPLIRMDAQAILAGAGFRVHAAANAEEALQILDRHGPAIRLLFTDVQMPPGPLTGFDLAWLCAKTWPQIGILVASGAMAPEPGDIPERAVFLQKPFSEDFVRNHLKTILSDSQGPQDRQTSLS